MKFHPKGSRATGCSGQSPRKDYRRFEMVFVIPMMMAVVLAVTAVSVIGIAALRESERLAVFHHDVERR